jgi:head-tail adaptor
MPTPSGRRRHRALLQNPGVPMPDADGGYTQTWYDLNPATLNVEIQTREALPNERQLSDTIVAAATHVVTGPYHQQLRVTSRLIVNGRVFSVVGLSDPDERQIEQVILCVETMP